MKRYHFENIIEEELLFRDICMHITFYYFHSILKIFKNKSNYEICNIPQVYTHNITNEQRGPTASIAEHEHIVSAVSPPPRQLIYLSRLGKEQHVPEKTKTQSH